MDSQTRRSTALPAPVLAALRLARPAYLAIAAVVVGGLAAVPGTPALAQAAGSTAERHLFGQSPVADQIGHGYIVLERSGDRIYGALYYPSSSFDCFSGQVQDSALAMTIVNSYDQEAYPYSLALAEGPAIATAAGAPAPLGLDGFYAIEQLSANDLRMLDQCRSLLNPGG